MGELDAIQPGMLRISHRTIYRYAKPVKFLPHRLVIRPREGHDLRVERMTITIPTAHHLMWSRDVFGNSVATVYFDEPADELSIESDVLVERFALSSSQILASVAPVPYPPQYDVLEQVMLTAYLTPMYPEDADAVRQWVTANVPADFSGPVEDLLADLTQRIFDTIKYRRREEKGVQSPATTLSMGSGSCRDAATLLMEAARHLNIPSRFASGYLDCAATRGARGSTHAWTEVYFPNLGWRGFDPTTGKRCTYGHILVGVSNHSRGVMPISGRFVGEASAYLGMNVIVAFSEIAETESP